MKIMLYVKSAYGRDLIYASCDKSELLLKLTGKKTFDSKDLHVIRSLGYEIEFKQDVPKL